MNNAIEDNKFSWNAVVRVKDNVPECSHPGEIASVCGMEKVEFQEVAQQYHTQVGRWIYTIEFNGGNDITIPEEYLELLERAAE